MGYINLIIYISIFLTIVVMGYRLLILERRDRRLMEIVNHLRVQIDRQNAAATDDKATDADEPEDVDEDEQLFLQLDRLIEEKKLYLKPDLNRNDLARLIGVEKNRFGRIITNYSGFSNSAVYINIKRVGYGAKLLVEHPEYTINTIANECGMSNTVTFNRTFKEVFGVTPSAYRDAKQASLSEYEASRNTERASSIT